MLQFLFIVIFAFYLSKYHFSAVTILMLTSVTSLPAVLVVPALRRAASNMSETLRRISETLQERRARLAAVRQQQQQLGRRHQLADGDPAGADSDLYSDSSSVSGVTTSSGGSRWATRIAERSQ